MHFYAMVVDVRGEKMKKYYTYTVKKLVSVQHLVTIEHFQDVSDFSYNQESHNFYECIYVENGSINCVVDDRKVVIGNNNFFIIPPDAKHSYFIEKGPKTSFLILCFKSKSTIISDIVGGHYLEDNIKELISSIIVEAKQTFVFPFNKKLTLKDQPQLGSQQLIENYIEEILIKLFQQKLYTQKNIHVVADSRDIRQSVTKEISKLLKENLYSRISLSEISHQMFYSKTYLNQIYKSVTGKTIMQDYQDMKIDEAKKLLIKNKSVSTIANALFYESPQHFSKAFKAKTGLTPTEYRDSTENNNK